MTCKLSMRLSIVFLCESATVPTPTREFGPNRRSTTQKQGPLARAVKKCLDVHEMPTIGLARFPTLGMAGGAASGGLSRPRI